LAATILTLLMLHLSVGPSVGAIQTQGLHTAGIAGVSPEMQDSLRAGWSRQRSSGHSVARLWDEQLLDAIRIDIPKPPAHARNLFHLSVAMWDAWAAYAPTAVGYLVREKQTAEELKTAREEAISYAAYRLLKY